MIVTKAKADGTEEQYEFYLDIEKAIEMEEKKGVNIFDAMESITTAKGNPSLSGINNLCIAMLGYTLPALIERGFTIGELVGNDGIVLKVIEESGFTSALKGGITSPEKAVDPLKKESASSDGPAGSA